MSPHPHPAPVLTHPTPAQILKQHEDLDQNLKNSRSTHSLLSLTQVDLALPVRLELRSLEGAYDKSEDDIKALQSVGQIIGEVLKQLDEERFIVKASSGPRYVVGCRSSVPKHKLKNGTRVSLDMTTLTIMRSVCCPAASEPQS